MKPDFKGYVKPIKPIIDAIRDIESKEPKLLPLRKKGAMPAWVTQPELRKINENYYKSLNESYVRNKLFEKYNDGSGIYFFISENRDINEFYYIGVATSLIERIIKWIRNLDFIFYSIAFPENKNIYRKESLRFYGEAEYPEHYEEYVQQFKCLDEVGVEYIAWISNDIYSRNVWKSVEEHFIYNYQPCVNRAHKSSYNPYKYADEYMMSDEFFNNSVVNNIDGFA